MITLEDTIKNYKGSKIAELSFLRENLNDSKSVFIIGERDGGEGVVGTVLNTPNINTIVCNDINNIEPNSILDRSINQWPDRVKFYCHDFNTIENINCDTLICISVLEHFGFIYNSYKCYVNIQNYGDDVILWNYDLLGLKKMIEIIKNNINCKAIITVPAGQPVCGPC